ncbi:MAG: CBS domain-containing protein [Candidatus Omnitrophica bacterium]|nr:CBS domain-containing protein [Candidatus Omnitrophota bacterium]MCM8770983.1 CBS domain-containing protein [Candidatus Omnitrophota bacterium]
MKVKEIMIKEVISISPQTNAQEALDLLEKMQISGLPVIDKDGKLVGMFTEKDILRHILPGYVEKVGTFVYEEDTKAIKRKFNQLSTLQVGELMRREVVTTSEDTSLYEVARLMLTQKARRIPVLDKTGKVLGIIARCDILRALRKEITLADK